ncbi:hypothetical protein HHK36_024685 [Tetracentron sinense]|uniref:Uncharacterized protein n=1 Tax=Tetracentron sinense TaxID=13715 RepID=A0A835D4H0_TETSI|nr:hypothetical protein HHK36_024685 [Tetracentron sinense]
MVTFINLKMKFGKEFASQMVPEWQEAYMNYNYLKTLLKEIQRFKHRTKPPATPGGLKRKLTLYRAFSGLTQKYNHHMSPTGGDIEDQVILVNAVEQGGSDGHYETKFLMSAEEGGEYELVYFRRLDDEFNKVDKFYRAKVEEVMKEAALLNKQMDALIAFRIKVENPQGWFDRTAEMTRLASDVATSTGVLMATTPSRARTSRRVQMDVIEEVELSNLGQLDESNDETEVNETKNTNHNVREEKPNNIKATRPAPLDILSRVKINNTLETPRSTLKGFLKVSKNTEVNFRGEDLRKVEEQLKRAFVEFYQKLRLLKSYSFLNLLAFSKIMKKYDKITSRNASKSYLKMVDNSNLGSSDEVTKLMDRVEATFIKHFSNSNRSKGINILRPKAKRERHRTTFLSGFFGGCTTALIVALILIIRARHILDEQGSTQYMENMFPLYSLFGFIVLHMLMYAVNIYFWRRYRVNYSFIFGFKQGTELGYREIFLLSSGLAVLALASVLSNLDMQMDPKTKDYKVLTELLPLGLVVLVIVITFCPFNIIYRSSRYFLLQCAFHCICAPLYKVTLPDFFLADQLTSQVQAIRSLEFYICYYGWGDYKHRQNTCKSNAVYETFYFIIAVIPYWSRLLQCLRRLYEEKDPMQGYNGLKYLSTIIAVSMRTAYSLHKVTGWKTMAWFTSGIAAIVSTYWDLVVDWGLLQRHSKNRWLRDKLVISHKSVYFGAIILNVLLRFAWLQTVLNFKVSSLHREALITIVASLEIIRRGMWNFFRLENEHLNNVGKYRAFKSVPLPFNYDEDEDKDEGEVSKQIFLQEQNNKKMKFGKEFASQTVPEWQEAYMDFNYLKTLLKEIQRFKHRTKPPATPSGLKRKLTMYRAFSGLTQKYNHNMSPTGGDIEDQVILVNAVEQGGSDGHYETKFLMSAEEGGEYELVYFRRLDDEFNKVNKFYRTKVEEVMKEAELLNKQMDALIAFRIKVENPQGWFDRTAEMTRLASDVATSTGVLMATTPSRARKSGRAQMDVIEEIELRPRGQLDELNDETENNETKNTNHNVREEKPNNIKATRPAPLDILSRVKINNTLETPRSTLKGLLKVSKNTEVNFRGEDLRKVEEQLKQAFVEFYQKLRLLKSYSFLNLLAFSKIMKKYDKITSRNASKSYLKIVDNSNLGSSDEVTKLMERVEATFIKHFSNSNRSKGMNILRPKAKRERHRTTFLSGFFGGCTTALIVALILIVRARHTLDEEGTTQYMDNMFPLYSLFGFIVLHMLMYAVNIYFWRRYRVNYSFIFGFKQGTELGYREIFLLSSGLAVLALATVLSNLDMQIDPKTKDYKVLTELLPLGLVVLVVVITFCPFNIIYRSSRYFLLQCAFHCICAPLYKVTLPDFFLADQLTSQVQAFRSLEFYICYYGWGDYKHRLNFCEDYTVYKIFYFIVAVIPYLFRLLQCLRRLFEEKDSMQGYNGLKYLSTIIAVSMRTAYSQHKVMGLRMTASITSGIAAIVSTYWDLVIDWGLLQRHSKNRWLRDKLIISNKSVYFGAMILNVLLRFAWVQTVLNVEVPFLHGEALVAIFASLEIIRRGIWNFFRLENEHLNNVGKYRAFKSVPLPFNYDEDEDKDE